MSVTDAIASKKPKASAKPAAPKVKNEGSVVTLNSRYAAAALEKECRAVTDADKGTRNDTLNRAAFCLGGLIAAGALDEDEVTRALLAAARWESPVASADDAKKIADGIRAGKAEPREIPPPKYEQRTNGARRVNEDGEPIGEPPPGRFDDDQEDGPELGPTAENPLRGLTYLSKVALVGRDELIRLAAAPVAYAWKDIVVEETIAVVAGASGEGKTTLMFLLIVARANVGEPVDVLGRRVEPARVGTFEVLIEGEHGGSSTARKLISSVRLLGIDDRALDRVIVVARKAVVLGSPEWADVVKLIRAGLVSDIVLDTLARVAPADANDEREQVAIFNLIAQAIDAAPDGTSKPTAWVITHTKKNGSGGLEDVSGSAQRVGQADTVLRVVGERVDGRIVSSTVTFWKLREPPEDYPTPVTFSITKNSDGEPCLDTADAADAKPDDRPLETRITEALRTGPQTKNALAKLLARSWKDIDEAIGVLFSTKAIRTGTPKRVKGKDCPTFEIRGPISLSRQCVNPVDEFDGDFQDGLEPK